MALCFFASDLHGHRSRYDALFAAIASQRPAGVFLGGDLLPHAFAALAAGGTDDFVEDYLKGGLRGLRSALGVDYPDVYLILGNDDPRVRERDFLDGDAEGLWHYAHQKRLTFLEWEVYGYAHVPPTPFLLKDWERFDVSRYIDPGCVSPEKGMRSVPVPQNGIRYRTIAADLADLTGERDLSKAICLFHTPPYDTRLDRAALDGKMIEHVPLDVHIGSIAVRRFMEGRQPLLGLHGHVHESARLAGDWRDRIGRTVILSAAHDGPELALVRFDPERPEAATRELL